jgi:glycerol-3-phosphate dehydrogenase
MVCSLSDFFTRRTGLINFNINRVVKWKTQIAESCKALLQWDDQKTKEDLAILDAQMSSITAFRLSLKNL